LKLYHGRLFSLYEAKVLSHLLSGLQPGGLQLNIFFPYEKNWGQFER
jgi:hypothetical protein